MNIVYTGAHYAWNVLDCNYVTIIIFKSDISNCVNFFGTHLSPRSRIGHLCKPVYTGSGKSICIGYSAWNSVSPMTNSLTWVIFVEFRATTIWYLMTDNVINLTWAISGAPIVVQNFSSFAVFPPITCVIQCIQQVWVKFYDMEFRNDWSMNSETTGSGWNMDTPVKHRRQKKKC